MQYFLFEIVLEICYQTSEYIILLNKEFSILIFIYVYLHKLDRNKLYTDETIFITLWHHNDNSSYTNKTNAWKKLYRMDQLLENNFEGNFDWCRVRFFVASLFTSKTNPNFPRVRRDEKISTVQRLMATVILSSGSHIFFYLSIYIYNLKNQHSYELRIIV